MIGETFGRLCFANIWSSLKPLILGSLMSRLPIHNRSTVSTHFFLKSTLRNQVGLALENLALRQQPAILKRKNPMRT